MVVSTGGNALPVHDDVGSDPFLPLAETLLVAGDPRRGSADDIAASTPHAAVFAGERLRDDGS